MLEKKLQEELNRFRAINKYAKKMIVEQDLPDPTEDPLAGPPTDQADPSLDPAASPDAGAGDPNMGMPPADPAADPMGDTPPMDDPTMADPSMGDMGDSTEEIDITDLVNMTKSIKKDMDMRVSDQTNVLGKMDSVFSKLDDLESKLAQMDALFSKIDELGSKVSDMKEPKPEERLQMRSLDSYPFSQNPQQFFAQKQGEMKQSGKNEYILTKDEVDNYSNERIKDTFNPDLNQDEFRF